MELTWDALANDGFSQGAAMMVVVFVPEDFSPAWYPRSDSDVTQWQNFIRKYNRSTLSCFAGVPRDTFKNNF